MVEPEGFKLLFIDPETPDVMGSVSHAAGCFTPEADLFEEFILPAVPDHSLQGITIVEDHVAW